MTEPTHEFDENEGRLSNVDAFKEMADTRMTDPVEEALRSAATRIVGQMEIKPDGTVKKRRRRPSDPKTELPPDRQPPPQTKPVRGRVALLRLHKEKDRKRYEEIVSSKNTFGIRRELRWGLTGRCYVLLEWSETYASEQP